MGKRSLRARMRESGKQRRALNSAAAEEFFERTGRYIPSFREGQIGQGKAREEEGQAREDFRKYLELERRYYDIPSSQ